MLLFEVKELINERKFRRGKCLISWLVMVKSEWSFDSVMYVSNLISSVYI